MAGGLIAAAPAWAEVVSATKVNCREEPSLSSPVVTTVTRGKTVTVIASEGAWSQATLANGETCWIASEFLESAERAGYEPGSNIDQGSRGESASTATTYSGSRQGSPSARSGSMRTPTRAKPSRSRTASKPSRRQGSRRSGASGGSCPCSGPTICIGPRGGRYCITSGGNKRYGV
ncbi:SH3 domain-containing protein [Porphyrobacter sp. SLTP]|uniref:SH3 domain-containing protein n=1 Tax=Porphyrobacter sp. SLTP TaxID=2683266 RepID=UPI00336BD70A